MRKIVFVLMLAFAVFLGGCSRGLESLDLVKESDGNHNSVTQTQLDDLDKLLNDLQTQLDKLTNLNAEAHAAFQSQIDKLNGDLIALEVRVSNNEEDVAGLQLAVDDLKTRVGDVEGRLAVLEAYIVKVNSPLFASVVLTDSDIWVQVNRYFGYWKRDVQDPGVTVVWTASAGGDVATSYNVYAVAVSDNGALGVPFLIANGTGSEYFWDGHTEGLPVGFNNGPNPVPLNVVSPQCDDSGVVYRFAVTAADENGNQSAPAVTEPGKEIKIVPSPLPE